MLLLLACAGPGLDSVDSSSPVPSADSARKGAQPSAPPADPACPARQADAEPLPPLPPGTPLGRHHEDALARIRVAARGLVDGDLAILAGVAPALTDAERDRYARLREAGFYGAQAVGYSGSVSEEWSTFHDLKWDEGMLLTAVRDRSPAVRAYATELLVERGWHTAAVLGLALADEGEYVCQHGCTVDTCTVGKQLAGGWYDDPAELDALTEVAARGSPIASERACWALRRMKDPTDWEGLGAIP